MTDYTQARLIAAKEVDFENHNSHAQYLPNAKIAAIGQKSPLDANHLSASRYPG